MTGVERGEKGEGKGEERGEERGSLIAYVWTDTFMHREERVERGVPVSEVCARCAVDAHSARLHLREERGEERGWRGEGGGERGEKRGGRWEAE